METFEETMSPEAFSWCYTAAEILGDKNKRFSEEDKKSVRTYLTQRVTPNEQEICTWYLDPFIFLEGRTGMPCTLEDIQEYWRNIRMSGENPVILARIKEVGAGYEGKHCAAVKLFLQPKETSNIFVSNIHGYPLSGGEVVYVHHYAIAELTPPHIVQKLGL